jgi:predicted RecB family endonuclease
LAVVDPRGIPEFAAEIARCGAWVENACLAHAWNAGLRVTYRREEPWEVDGVIEGSWAAWAIEVKTGAFDTGALRGVLEFSRRFPGCQPLVLCDAKGEITAERAGVQAMRWRDFLLSGPPKPPTRLQASGSRAAWRKRGDR